MQYGPALKCGTSGDPRHIVPLKRGLARSCMQERHEKISVQLIYCYYVCLDEIWTAIFCTFVLNRVDLWLSSEFERAQSSLNWAHCATDYMSRIVELVAAVSHGT